MPCYKPLVRVEHTTRGKVNKNGKFLPKVEIYPLTEHHKRHTIEELETNLVYHEDIIPCGKCIGCRLEYSRQWANRGYLEAQLHDENYFITLTYDDEHLIVPEKIELYDKVFLKQENWMGDLNKKHLQLFFKRLRKRIGKFSYMGCGEYGSKNGRPHYHAILFGAHLDVKTFYNPRLINKEWYYQNDIIEECWTEETGSGGNHSLGRSMGFSNISVANWNTIAYTARYVTKKINGEGSEELYAAIGRTTKEFIVTSRNPAIGKEWYEQHKDEINKTDKIMIHNKKGTHEVTVPKYFDTLREKEDLLGTESKKRKRKNEAQKRAAVKNETTTLSQLEQLAVEEREKEKQSKMLIRGYEPKKDRNHSKDRPRPRREELWLKGITMIPKEE